MKYRIEVDHKHFVACPLLGTGRIMMSEDDDTGVALVPSWIITDQRLSLAAISAYGIADTLHQEATVHDWGADRPRVVAAIADHLGAMASNRPSVGDNTERADRIVAELEAVGALPVDLTGESWRPPSRLLRLTWRVRWNLRTYLHLPVMKYREEIEDEDGCRRG